MAVWSAEKRDINRRYNIEQKCFSNGQKTGQAIPGFAACAIGMAAAAFFSVFDQMLPVFQGQYQEMGLEAGFALHLASLAFSSELTHLALPVLCALPFAAAFLEDYRSRFWRFYLLRSGTEDYVSTRAAVTALAGGCLFLPAWRWWYFCSCCCLSPGRQRPGRRGWYPQAWLPA